MGRVLRNTDVLAGAGAVAVLLLAVLGLNLALPIGLGLAVAAYIGLRLALPKAAAPDQEAAFAATLARCEEQVTAIQQFAGWAGFAGKPEVRERLLAIHRIARRILTAIAQDPNKRSGAEPFLTEYLNPITSVLASYVRLAGRDLELGHDELAAIESETLPLVERRLNTLYEQIHSADLATLELDTKMLEYTLQPISVESPPSAIPLPDLPARLEGGSRTQAGRQAARREADATKEHSG
jgi:hypothetical protein